MNQFPLFVYALVTLTATCSAGELMFFADDHYKAAGEPILRASAINPMLEPGVNTTLRINLANFGLIQELIPTNLEGDPSDISAEAEEELHSIDASNITATLLGSESVVVTSGPIKLLSLPAGSVAKLNFNITTGEQAVGWYNLVLNLESEHQMDVKVGGSGSSSLYQPASSSQKISILVQGPDRSLEVVGVDSDLYPGSNGTIYAVIKNNGFEIAKNCSARLSALSPFRSTSDRYVFGDLLPGQAKVIRLSAIVDSKAAIREYNIACEIFHDNKTVIVALPIIFGKSPGFITGLFSGFFSGNLFRVVLFFVIVAIIVVIMLRRRSSKSFKRRKRW